MDQQQGFVNDAMEKDDQMNEIPLQPEHVVQDAENNQAIVGHASQEGFINLLINKDDQVSGWSLRLNRLLVHCMKCFMIRKKQKIQTITELFLPILIFIYILFQTNILEPIDGNPNKIDKVTSPISNNLLSNFDLKDNNYPYSPLYYDLKNGSVDPKQLEAFLKGAFSDEIK